MSDIVWKKQGNAHCLYFTPYYDEELVAKVEGGGRKDWCIESEMLGLEGDYLAEGNESLESVKIAVEDMVIEHYQEEASFATELLKKFEGEVAASRACAGTLSTRERIKAIAGQLLGSYDLQGVELTDEDYDAMECALSRYVVGEVIRDESIEEAVKDVLSGIRDCLDEGLEEEDRQ